MSRPERVLVTGAAGFIGSSLVDRLIGEGREVVGLDSFDPFYAESEKLRNLDSAVLGRTFRLVRGDIRDATLLSQVFSEGRFDVVVHLAALAGVRPSLERPAAYTDVNVNGTAQLLEAAVRSECPRFVFASSSSVYGEREAGPFFESDRVDHPISPYAATKRAGELLSHSFHVAHGLKVACIRFFTAYGPRQRPDLAIRKFSACMLEGKSVPIFGDGGGLRDFTYIEDVVDGVVRTLDASLEYRLLNIGSGREISVLEMVRQLEESLHISAKIEWLPRQVGDVSRTWADITAARETLGYSPRVSFKEGIERFVAWLKERC